MDETAQIPTLEELALIRISISLWSKESLRKFMRMRSNGLVNMDEAVSLLIKSVNDFELSVALKKKLIDVFERVGYELYVFMSESILNFPVGDGFTNTSNRFPFCTSDDLKLSDLKWNQRGEILVSDTLTSYMINHQSASQFLLFRCACEICDEKNVRKIWDLLTPLEKDQIKLSQSWSKNFLFLNYWLCLLENHLNDFLIHYGSNILTFDDRNSLNYNLLKYSIMRCFRSNITYFYSKLTDAEKADIFETVKIGGKNAIILHEAEAFWYMKYINKYFELPIMNHQVNKFIVKRLSQYSFRDLIDYNIQQVGKFGDLQCNIFIYLLSIAPFEIKSLVLKNLDFYLLNLIGKGKLSYVKSFLMEGNKKMLCMKIMSDLENSENLARFSIICMNNHSDSLKEFFDLIAEKEEDRIYLQMGLKSIEEGAQYDHRNNPTYFNFLNKDAPS